MDGEHGTPHAAPPHVSCPGEANAAQVWERHGASLMHAKPLNTASRPPRRPASRLCTPPRIRALRHLRQGRPHVVRGGLTQPPSHPCPPRRCNPTGARYSTSPMTPRARQCAAHLITRRVTPAAGSL
ncbi:hypothetical protein Dvul_0467 [Nitratidesulfovibrio vulgaris DP4]|uniref:Uncharacterized protein n=1 Tax=Nitratidesulfovibrio vulgaris (strain DP4) TaxID=391774 RepID=A0A0H3A4S8_NITV4|nr:hypothetical protein Dvul_0467 [Nitratidesulfovibrio vulgaris DP4]